MVSHGIVHLDEFRRCVGFVLRLVSSWVLQTLRGEHMSRCIGRLAGKVGLLTTLRS